MTTNLLIAGLPEAGKSTFLAAFYYCLERPIGRSRYKFQLESLPSDSRYINDLVTLWSDCKPLQRTVISSAENLILDLKDQDGKKFRMSAPDLSGELYERLILQERRFPEAFEKSLQEATGIVIFINPCKVVEPNRTDDLLHISGNQGETTASEGTQNPISDEQLFEGIPTQVKIVDLLQLFLPEVAANVKFAIVVSAWDSISALFQTAEAYIEQRLPLLNQFLSVQENEVRIFALSAQGGDLEADQARLRELSPADRILVRIGNRESKDLTEIVAWLHE